MNRLIYLFLICLGAAVIACSDSDVTTPPATPTPSIASFSPSEGITGNEVVINGTNFSTTVLDNVVQFNGTPALVSSATPTSLVVFVPDSARTGKIKVTVGGNAATSENDFSILSPTVGSFSPMLASPGMTIRVTGTNFSPDKTKNIIHFGTIKATVTSASQTQLEAVIPAAAPSGKVVVQVGTQKAGSADEIEICDGHSELIVSQLTITAKNDSKTQFSFSYTLTNVGNVPLDLTKMVLQNYVSQNTVIDAGDKAAGGFILDAGGVLDQGESYTGSWTSTVDFSAHPYLIVHIYVKEGQVVDECNTENNTVPHLIE